MPLVGWKCVKNNSDKSFKDCVNCAMTDEHCEFSPEMLSLMSRDVRSRKQTDRVSVTTLTQECLRKVVIEDRFDYRMSPRRGYFFFRGNFVHAMLEHATLQDGWSEISHSRTIELEALRHTIEVVGRIDKIVLSKKLIRDNKTIYRLPNESSGSHALQLNIYRWLWQDIFLAERLRLQYIDMTGTKQIKVDVMPLEEVDKLVRERAAAYVLALKSESLPKDAYDKTHWWCRYCDVADICKSLNEGGKANGEKDRKKGKGRKQTSKSSS